MLKTKKYRFYLLFFLILFSQLLRFPNQWVFGSMGSDAHGIHLLTVFSIEKGHIPWGHSPLGYLGMIPYSEPTAPHIISASIAMATGLHLEVAILPFSLFLGLFGTLMAFIVGYTIFRNFELAFFVALIFTVNHYYWYHTFWKLSERGTFIAFMPFLYYSLLRFLNFRKSPAINILFFIFSLFILYTSHRMNAFIIPTIIFPIVLVIIFNYLNSYNYANPLITFSRKNIYIFLFLIFGSILIINVFSDVLTDLGYPQEETWIPDRYDNIPFLGHALNIAFIYSMWGILHSLAPIGATYLFLKSNKNKFEKYYTVILCFQSAFVLDVEYFLPVFSISLSILVVYAIKCITQVSSKEWKAYILIFLSSSACLFSMYDKNIQTQVQVERDKHPTLDGYEQWHAAFWRVEYIAQDEMTISNNPYLYRLFFVESFSNIDERIIMMDNSSYYKNLDYDLFSFWEILFHQRGYFYGGEVTHPISGKEDIWDGSHIFAINYMWIQYPSWDYLTDYYNLRYVIDCRPNAYYSSTNIGEAEEGVPFDGTDLPFYSHVKENNYAIFSNEVYSFYYFDNEE